MPGHLALLTGRQANGEPSFEVVPASPRPDGTWQLLGTPALAEGCAEGDVVALVEDGDFVVQERGGNVSVISYAESDGTVSPHVAGLRRLVEPLGAKVEAPADGRWAVVTVPVAAGFPAIEAAMAEWTASAGQGWSYGNVYGEDDRPLDWW